MEVRIRGFEPEEYARFVGVFFVLVSVLVPYVEFERQGAATLFRLIGMGEALQYPGLDMIVVLLLVVLGAGIVVGTVTKVGGYLIAVGLLYFDLVVVLGLGLHPGVDPSFGSGFYLAVIATLLVIGSETVGSMASS